MESETRKLVEQRIDRFEKLWRSGRPLDLASLLEDVSDPGVRHLLLLELVAVDMEYRWRVVSAELLATAGWSKSQPRLEDYLERWPELGDAHDLPLDLIAEEFRVRQRWGDRPSIANFQERFPHARLTEVLERMLNELAGERVGNVRDVDNEAQDSGDTPTFHSDMSTTVGEDGQSQDDGLPRIWGDYRLLSVIGEGGMGTVYVARQLATDRHVALKVIRPDLLPPLRSERRIETIARFHQEVKAASSLEHDHIVRVYEAGEWEHTPYFSMQLVSGANLHQKLHAGPLDDKEAATILLPVARAIHAAHQKGIVHRDLKPQNILLDKDDRPYVSDFGLAKSLEVDTSSTRTGMLVGTPSYIAPEQVHGQLASPRSDVYSLGATLYEVLTGRPPFQAASVAATLRQVLEDEPLSPRRLNSAVSVDLATICLKCLEKEPSRRYASAEELGEDLRCFLEGLPVSVRPLGSIARLVRWSRREPRVALLAATALLLLLVALVGTTTGMIMARIEQHRAETNFEMAHDAVDELFVELSENELLQEHGMQETRRRLLNKPLKYYARFLEQRREDPTLKRELARMHYRIGFITELVDSPQQALTHYEASRTIASRLLQREPGKAEHLKILGTVWNAIGNLKQSLRQLEAAEQAYTTAISYRARLATAWPGNQEYQRLLANSHMNMGLLEQSRGRFEEAVRRLESAQQLRLRLVQEGSRDRKLRRDLGKGYFVMATTAMRQCEQQPQTGDASQLIDSAIQQFQDAIDVFEELHEERPTPDTLARLAQSYNLLADLRRFQGTDDPERRQKTLALYAQAQRMLEVVVVRNPDVLDYQASLAGLHLNMSLLRMADQDWHEAVADCMRGQELLVEALTKSPERLDLQRDLVRSLQAKATALAYERRWSEAKSAMDEAGQHVRSLVTKRPHNEAYQQLLAEIVDGKNALAQMQAEEAAGMGN